MPTMLKSLAFALLVTAAACKSDKAPAQASAGGASSEPGETAAGPRPRSGKIDVPRRGPGLSGADGEARDDAGSDARRARRRERAMAADTDGDGVISAEEREAEHQRRMAAMKQRLDTDGDGKVSDEERAAAFHMRADEMRTRLDANGDGKVTADELAAGRRMRGLTMQEIDTDHDGDVSAEELENAMRHRAARRTAGGSAAPAAQPPQPPQ
jgi:hypothetical protein